MADSCADAVLASLRPVVDGLAATFGPWCEVVLHDYRQGEKSVVAVAGRVTGRRVGGSLSEIGLRVLAQGEHAVNDLNYVTRTRDGRVARSSTMPLRDDEGRVFGALCVNLDVTTVRQAADLLAALGGAPAAALPSTTFTDDFDEVVDAVVRAEELALGRSVEAMSRDERIVLLRALEARGVFAVRGAAPQVARRLGISRSGLYADLAEARRDGAAGDAAVGADEAADAGAAR